MNPESTYLAEKYPLVDVIWNRWNAVKDNKALNLRPNRVHGYEVQYVHGHDTFQSPHAHITNLDTPCGKARQGKQEERVKQFHKTLENSELPARTQGLMIEYLQTVNVLKVMEETS